MYETKHLYCSLREFSSIQVSKQGTQEDAAVYCMAQQKPVSALRTVDTWHISSVGLCPKCPVYSYPNSNPVG